MLKRLRLRERLHRACSMRGNSPRHSRPRFDVLEDRRLMSGFARSFDAHPATDMAVWRPTTGTFFVLTSGTGFDRSRPLNRQWGASGDVVIGRV